MLLDETSPEFERDQKYRQLEDRLNKLEKQKKSGTQEEFSEDTDTPLLG
jgi:hypothetical protein